MSSVEIVTEQIEVKKFVITLDQDEADQLAGLLGRGIGVLPDVFYQLTDGGARTSFTGGYRAVSVNGNETIPPYSMKKAGAK